MKEYPSYKDSFVKWIGKIPNDWNTKRIRYLFEVRKRISGELGFDVISITQEGIKIKDISSGEGQLSSDYTKYQIVEVGDFAMNQMDLLTGYVDISRYNGVTSPDYRVFALIDKNCISQYYLYLFQICYLNKIFFGYGQGSSQLGRWRLPEKEFKDIKFPYPNKEQQQKIVAYLNIKVSQIDSLICKTLKKIDLLKEKRVSLINQVTTKGLDSSVEFKNSGIEWIGKFPCNWKVKKLKYISTLITEKKLTNAKDIKISPENVESYTGKCNNLYSDYSGYGFQFRRGDILFNKLRLYLVKVLLADYDGFSMGEMIVIRTNESVHNKYFYYMLFNQGLIEYLDSQSTGIKVPRVSPSIIMGTYLPCPPKEKQIDIVEYLDNEITKIYEIIEKEFRKIELLRELRQSLITKVVTGKINISDEDQV